MTPEQQAAEVLDVVYVESTPTNCTIGGEHGQVTGVNRRPHHSQPRPFEAFVSLDNGRMLHCLLGSDVGERPGTWFEVAASKPITRDEFDRINGLDTLRTDLGWYRHRPPEFIAAALADAGVLRDPDSHEAAVEQASLGTIVASIEAWGQPLADILATEGHDHECDAVLSNNATLCDCWWGRLKAACDGLVLVQDAARDTLAATIDGAAHTTGHGRDEVTG